MEEEKSNPVTKKLSEDISEKILNNINSLIDVEKEKLSSMSSDEKLEYVSLCVEAVEVLRKLKTPARVVPKNQGLKQEKRKELTVDDL
jgi:hypothetical protein